jgi:hypothetical protein
VGRGSKEDISLEGIFHGTKSVPFTLMKESHMRKLLLASVALVAMSTAALADTIILQATLDGVVVGTATSANGTLNLNNQAFGGFNLNTVSINDQNFLAPPGVLNTNTLDVAQTLTGSHTLLIDIAATGQSLGNTTHLQNFLSEFSVTGLTPGWTVQEQTTINGNQLSITPVFGGTSAAVDVAGSAIIGPTFTADVHYIIKTNGPGQFNGGIDINAAAVPGPIVGAGAPGIIAAGMFLLGMAKRRKNKLVA